MARGTQDDLVDEQKENWNGRSGRNVIPPFDDETLGGHVSYSALIDPARNLQGRLKGLVIRYESQPVHHVQTQGLSTRLKLTFEWLTNYVYDHVF